MFPEKVPESHRHQAASVSRQQDCSAETSSVKLLKCVFLHFSCWFSLVTIALLLSVTHDDQATSHFFTLYLHFGVFFSSLMANLAEIAQRPLDFALKQLRLMCVFACVCRHEASVYADSL